MGTLFLREADVEQLADMPLALGAVRDAFQMLADGTADNVPRVRAKGAGIILHSMIGAASALGVVGWKHYTTTRQGARFLVGLYDQSTGRNVALIEANRLGQMRTGAATGLAVSRLTDTGADAVGMLGSGWQAASQLEAVAGVRTLRRALVYSRDPARREAFCRALSGRLGLPVVPAAQAEDAVREQPIVITATSSATPVCAGNWLAPGALVCAIGSNWPHKAELDLEAVRQATAVVCDSVSACQHEAGELIQAAAAGAFDWSDAVELADVVIHRQPGRESPSDRIVFKSVGLAIEDVVLAARILERARARGMGERLPFE